MDMFYALAEPRRRRIIEILAAGGRMTATQIYSNFEISPQAISQHLKVLLDADLLHMEKKAQQHIYEINPESMLEVEEWIKKTTEQWDARLLRLEEVLQEQSKRAKKIRGETHEKTRTT